MNDQQRAELERRKQLALDVFGKTLADKDIEVLGARIDAAANNARILEAFDRSLGLTEPAATHRVDCAADKS